MHGNEEILVHNGKIDVSTHQAAHNHIEARERETEENFSFFSSCIISEEVTEDAEKKAK